MTSAQELEKLIISIVGDGSHYRRTTEQVKKQTKDMESTVSKTLDNMHRKMKRWGAAATVALTLPILGLGAAMVKMAAQAETTQMQFEVMLGKDRGDRLVKNIHAMAAATPFQKGDLEGAGRTLLAFGTGAEQVVDTMRMLGDVSAGTGKDLKELSVIYGQIRGLGRLQGQDFLQLVNAGVPVAEIAKVMGTNMAGLKDAMEAGLVPFEAVEMAFQNMTSEGGIFNNMMERLSQTTAGRFSTALDNVKAQMIALGADLLPLVGELLEQVQEWVDWFAKLDKDTKKLIVTVAAFAAALGPVAVALSAVMSVIKLLNAALLTPAGLVATIVALGAAFAMAATDVGGLGTALDNMGSKFGKTNIKAAFAMILPGGETAESVHAKEDERKWKQRQQELESERRKQAYHAEKAARRAQSMANVLKKPKWMAPAIEAEQTASAEDLLEPYVDMLTELQEMSDVRITFNVHGIDAVEAGTAQAAAALASYMALAPDKSKQVMEEQFKDDQRVAREMAAAEAKQAADMAKGTAAEQQRGLTAIHGRSTAEVQREIANLEYMNASPMHHNAQTRRELAERKTRIADLQTGLKLRKQGEALGPETQPLLDVLREIATNTAKEGLETTKLEAVGL